MASLIPSILISLATPNTSSHTIFSMGLPNTLDRVEECSRCGGRVDRYGLCHLNVRFEPIADLRKLRVSAHMITPVSPILNANEKRIFTR